MSEKIPGVVDGNVASKAFSHRPWQRQILNDIIPNVVITKSRQLGLSSEDVSAMMHEHEKKANNENAKELL